MKLLETKTFVVNFYIGSRTGSDGKEFTESQLTKEISIYQKNSLDKVLCSIRLTKTKFVIRDYIEEGWELSTINYPSYPKEESNIRKFMEGLAKYLANKFMQDRIIIVFPEKTYVMEFGDKERNL